MKALLPRIFGHPALRDQPPVLVDVGASGALPPQWKAIAPYAVAVAFDADTRDFAVSESTNAGYRKLYSVNRLLAARGAEALDFYLARSPHCSSSLRPDGAALAPWAFSPLFEVEKVVRMPASSLPEALAAVGISQVDWYKTDSQGTDLRIFDALAAGTIAQVLVAEFEPGIIDAYVGEDKLHALMAYMDRKPFWVTGMNIKGSHRIAKEDLAQLGEVQRRDLGSFLKTAPGWCEIAYINTFAGPGLGLREHLLGWVFASIKGEHGFALHVAQRGRREFGDVLFEQLAEASRKSLARGYLKVAGTAFRRLAQLARGAFQ
ncbi:MAG TPA: hypothetical protein VIL30_25180 [Ramlibacter sp.]